MAYISTEEIKEIRNNLKKQFPEIKFSVRRGSGYYSLSVSIMKSPYAFKVEDQKGGNINQYHLGKENFDYGNNDLLKNILKVINAKNHYKSDIMTDYFDVGFYLTFMIGQWDKEYQQVAA